jgi:hypothetical protein
MDSYVYIYLFNVMLQMSPLHTENIKHEIKRLAVHMQSTSN